MSAPSTHPTGLPPAGPTLDRLRSAVRLSPIAGPHLFAFTSVAILVVAIHLSYEYLIAPTYAYMLLTYTPPDVPTYATMIALILALSLIMPLRMTRPSDFVLWGLFALVVIPSLTITHLARTLPTIDQLILGFTVTASFAVAILAGRLPMAQFARRIKPLRPAVFWIAIATFSGVTYLALAASGNLRLSLPGLGDVYTVRTAFMSTNANAILPYLMSNQGNIVNPLLMTIGLASRRWYLTAAGILGEVLLYATAGHKSVLFAVPAVLLVAWLFRRGRRIAGSVVAWGFAGVIIVSAVVDEILNTPWLSSLFTRRVIDFPGLLTGAWINVFSESPKAMFGYGFLRLFIPYYYDGTPPFVVASKFFNQPNMNANANLLADGYANFGWFGIAFEVAVLAVVLALANGLSRRVPLMPAIALTVMPVIALSNASMITSLLTHGIVLMLIVFAVTPRSVWLPKVRRGRPAAAGRRGDVNTTYDDVRTPVPVQ